MPKGVPISGMNSSWFKKGQTSLRKGAIVKQESKNKMSETRLNKFKNGEIEIWNKNKKMPEELVKKNSLGHKGQKSWNYIDGRSKILSPARYGDDWDDIRYLVYRRDSFTCQNCGIKNVKLDVHHIIPYLDGGSNEINNLISLCRGCHRRIESDIIKKIIKNKMEED